MKGTNRERQRRRAGSKLDKRVEGRTRSGRMVVLKLNRRRREGAVPMAESTYKGASRGKDAGPAAGEVLLRKRKGWTGNAHVNLSSLKKKGKEQL